MRNNNHCLIILVHSLFNLPIVEEQIKKLCSEDIIKTLDEEAIAKMKEPITDFLYRVKDKHPSSTSLFDIFFLFYCSSKNKSFDVAHRVMNFMSDNMLEPSKAQIEKYRQSKTSKTLNRFPSFEVLKKISPYYYLFETYEDWKEIEIVIEIEKELEKSWYCNLKKAYRSKTIRSKLNN